ncbi:MAG: Methyltransferase type 11 [Bacteroidetes bacterium]|nr:Methyltransferase type 11 [Bacteroidota bacterium]
MENNQQVFSSKEAVQRYAADTYLQKGERAILDAFVKKIAGGKVLDVGIGAGRTIPYISALAGDYTGVDYSEEFVEHCRAAHAHDPKVKVQWADARDLSAFDEHSFDFILFSFNGLDCVGYDDRKKILKQFDRILKQDGLLVYSFHNKGNLDLLYSFQFPRNPFKYPGEWRRMNQIREINGDKENYKSKDWFIIRDGGENFTLNNFYADPLHEKRLLEELGFTQFSFYESLTGKKLSADDVQSSDTPWIYITAMKG